MAGKKNRGKGSRKSRPFFPSSQVKPPPPTTSKSSANDHARRLTKLVAHIMGLNTLVVVNAEPATLQQLSKLRVDLALISSEYAIHSITVRDEKESLYCADPVFIPFPTFQVDYELGPTQELEDVLRGTVDKLQEVWMEADDLFWDSQNHHVKHMVYGTSSDLDSSIDSLSMRIEQVRERREASKAANVVTPRSVDVERLISAAVDKVSLLRQMLGAFRTRDKKMMEIVTSEARSLEKILFFFLRPNERAQEVSSLNLDKVRHHRKIERRLDFIFFQIALTMFKLIPLLEENNSGNAREILEHFDNVSETVWAAREIVRWRESSLDEFCRLMMERNVMKGREADPGTGENVGPRGILSPGGATSA